MHRLQRQITAEDRRRAIVIATPAKLIVRTFNGTLTVGMRKRSPETVKRIFDSEVPERMLRSDWQGAEQLLRDIDNTPVPKGAAANAIL